MSSHRNYSVCQTRILKSADYQACYRYGQKLRTLHFNLYLLASENIARYGLSVSRKAGNAVQRNRIKRLLREFFRLHLTLDSGWQIVAAAKKDAHLLTLREVVYELAPILRSINALSD